MMVLLSIQRNQEITISKQVHKEAQEMFTRLAALYNPKIISPFAKVV